MVKHRLYISCDLGFYRSFLLSYMNRENLDNLIDIQRILRLRRAGADEEDRQD